MRTTLTFALTALAGFALLAPALPATAAPHTITAASHDMNADAKKKKPKMVTVRTMPVTAALLPGQKLRVIIPITAPVGTRTSWKILSNTCNCSILAAKLPATAAAPQGLDVIILTPNVAVGKIVLDYYYGTGNYNTYGQSLGTVTAQW